MIAREAVLNHPAVTRLLKDHFVCLGIDNVGHPNMTDAERQWLGDRGGRACTQGMTVFTAGGTVLATGGGYEPGPVLAMLQAALGKYRPEGRLSLPGPTPAEERGKVLRPPQAAG